MSRLLIVGYLSVILAACQDGHRQPDPSPSDHRDRSAAPSSVSPPVVTGSARPTPEAAWGGLDDIEARFARPNLFAAPDGLPSTPSSFQQAKRQALAIYADHRTTLYCGCAFGADRAVQWESCGYEPRANPARAARIEWEHVVPARMFGAHRDCWNQRVCVKPRGGKRFRGRACCTEADAEFLRMESDLQNLVPAVGEVNGDRSDFPYGEIAGEPRRYGKCDFEVDFARRVAEPGPAVRGDVARASLYMYYVYRGAIPFTSADLRKFERWHREDPPSEWERTRNRRIASIQGGGNPLVP
jgi:deoxyribonuclease-1